MWKVLVTLLWLQILTFFINDCDLLSVFNTLEEAVEHFQHSQAMVEEGVEKERFVLVVVGFVQVLIKEVIGWCLGLAFEGLPGRLLHMLLGFVFEFFSNNEVGTTWLETWWNYVHVSKFEILQSFTTLNQVFGQWLIEYKVLETNDMPIPFTYFLYCLLLWSYIPILNGNSPLIAFSSLRYVVVDFSQLCFSLIYVIKLSFI